MAFSSRETHSQFPSDAVTTQLLSPVLFDHTMHHIRRLVSSIYVKKDSSRPSEIRSDSQQEPDQTNDHPLSSSTAMGILPPTQDVLCHESENSVSRQPCHLLALPPELRRMMFYQIFGSITVYLRSIPDAQDEQGTFRTWNNVLEWNNHCPSLLRVNHQVRDEALEAVLQNCVLDIWGSNGSDFFRSLPKVAPQIKHVTIAWDRCELTDYTFPAVRLISVYRTTFHRQLHPVLRYKIRQSQPP